MLMSKRILILPISTGYAHLMRCIALGENLAKKYQIFIAIHEKKKNIFPLSSKINVVITNESVFDRPVKVLYQYMHDKQSMRLVDMILKIVKKVNPDLIITDVHPAGMAAAWISNIRQIMIINSHIFPFSKGFPGFFSKTPDITKKLVAYPIEVLLDFWKRFFIGKVVRLRKLYGLSAISVEKALRSIPVIIPEIKQYNPLKKYYGNFHFVGPIVYEAIEKRDLALERELEKKKNGRTTIYLTFGGTGFGKKLLLRLINALSKKYFVIIAAGNIINENEVRTNKNIFIRKFIPGFSAAKISDIIVSHGSYGTNIQALCWGKPIVTVPFNLDQVFHSLKAQELQFGKTLISISAHHFIMDFNRQQEMAENVKVNKILNAVEAVLHNQKYKQSARKLSKLYKSLNGVNHAAKIVDRFMS